VNLATHLNSCRGYECRILNLKEMLPYINP
jgi:hypothetical protein